MQQLSLAGYVDVEAAESTSPSNVPAVRPMTARQPRDYQTRIASQALSLFRQRKSPLSVAATGTGKTFTAALGISQFQGRVLWLAHRIELIQQAKLALEDILGETVELETPGNYSSSARVVVASKDTLRTPDRLGRILNYDHFDLIVIDECHHLHAKASSYTKIIERYPSALHWGLTATPGRLDKRPLRYFDCQTDAYGIVEASKDSWLVPILAKRVKVTSVDLSNVDTVAGDFAKDELDAVMASESSLHGTANAILDNANERPGLVFSTGVDTARRQAEILNRYKPGCAMFVSGETSDEDRRKLFTEFGRTYQFLVNVGVATEGTDLPLCSLIAMCRPTQSPTLFQQMLGRGLRPEKGIDSAEDRAAWIQGSSKPNCLVLDFVGNAGKHRVATAADVLLDEALPQQVRDVVAAKLEQGLAAGKEISVAEAIEQELANESEIKEAAAAKVRAELESRLRIRGISNYQIQDIFLLGMGASDAFTETGMPQAATPGQVQRLLKLGISFDAGLSASDARKLLAEHRERNNLATEKQVNYLLRVRPSVITPELTKKQARTIMLTMWGKKRKW